MGRKVSVMRSTLIQILFHISDGVNYLAAGLCIIAAIATPFTIGIMHGFEEQVVTAIDRVFAAVAAPFSRS